MKIIHLFTQQDPLSFGSLFKSKQLNLISESNENTIVQK